MANIDPWQMVFDKACDLIDAILHEQPKSEVDALDIDAQVVGVLQDLAYERVDPRADWSVVIKPANKNKKLDEKIDAHFEIALRQSAYARILFESHMQKVKENFAQSVQPGMLMKLGEEMLSAFACAQQHATAWRLLTEVRDSSFELRSQKAAQVKAEKREEREVLLRSLIDSSLSRLRPAGGWRSHVLAAQLIARDLGDLAKQYSLSIPVDEDELSEKVQLMIWKEPRLRKAYNETAKQPLEEPVKTRKVIVNYSVGDGE